MDQKLAYGVPVPSFQKETGAFLMEEKGASSGPSQNSPLCPEASPQDSHGAVPQAHIGYIFTLPKYLEGKMHLIIQISFP